LSVSLTKKLKRRWSGCLSGWIGVFQGFAKANPFPS
jgi:hypothetical protein